MCADLLSLICISTCVQISSLSHCMSPSHRYSFFLSFFLKAGAVPPDRHETQHFRTKWTSSVRNWGKIAILRCPPQPFRTKWTSSIKNWGKIAILNSRPQPFRTKWTPNVKNWRKIAILSSPPQPFRTKWTSSVQNWRKIAILSSPPQPFRASNVKNWGKIAIFKFCGDPFARNGRRTSKTEETLRPFFSNLNPFARNGRPTSKTEEKMRFFSQIWTLSHETDVERQKLRKITIFLSNF